MLRKKNLVVVGLTTFNTEMLKISVSAIARIKSNFTLIIHNDNPNQTVTVRTIRKIGYRGRLHIINSTQNIGLRAARLRILDAAGKYAPSAEWIIYIDDDDILLSADIPSVGTNNFAVIQNSLVVRRRVSDLITATCQPQSLCPDGDNIVLMRPYLGLGATAVRIDIMRAAANILHAAGARLDEIDASLEYRPPVDIMMWNALNSYARHTDPNAAPIYMDSVNCIRNGIDSAAIKYGRPLTAPRNSAAAVNRALARYDAVISHAMSQF
ncbi:MAG: glycosyltransferase [Alphaproteobacteria bacterium]|nr:glycosyltransferase [Alphaproteobacteria bacterium]